MTDVLSMPPGAVVDEDDRARRSIERAFELKQRLYGPDSPEAATTLVNLGTFYWDTGDGERATTALELAVQIFDGFSGLYDREVATALTNLGDIHRLAGRLEASIAALRRAGEINDREYPVGHEAHAATLANMALVSLAVGDRDGGRRLLQEALDIVIHHHGEDDSEARHLRNVLEICHRFAR